MKIQSMLFDLDGTLINSLSDLAASINLMLKDLGRPPLGEDEVGSFIGDGVRVLVYRSLTATHANLQPPDEELHAQGIALMHSHYADQMLETTSLYPHVTDTLEFFRDKPKAVVTSKEVRFARLILDHFHIADYFQAIVGGDTVPARKPDPWPVREAIRALEISPADAVMIGDSENDVAAGRGAGARTCAACYGYRTAEQLAKTSPDVMINRFDELKELFH
ncbi:MAG TPA: phosphoglycolate phosphatase [Blastocatellia bacterium]|nr:phosphoglycolate phosphatase [Blastocatellia bacterium]